MALAIRAGMIAAPGPVTRRLAQDLLATAALSMEGARRSTTGPTGRA